MAGLYLHIPFCRRKCFYCDFFSVESNPAEIQDYPALLIRHLELVAAQDNSSRIETIYFGGGTPSLLTPVAIGRILERVHRLFEIAPDAEITLEANPGTVTLDSLGGYRAAGINRLSLGLQSCDDRHLGIMGRLHNRQSGLDAVQWARKAGFDNLSLDLMFALPGQTFAELENELDNYISLAPEHLSCYGLTVEPETQLHQKVKAKEISLPDDGFYADAYLLIHDRLTAAGFDHYEIANYALEGCRCRHNEAYWQRKPYLGIGAGAHSFRDQSWGSRSQVPDDIAQYRHKLDKGQLTEELLESFDCETSLSETVYLALRTRRGVLDSELKARYGKGLADEFPEALKACSEWLSCDSGRWSFNPEGWLLYDRLILHFL